MRTRPSLLRAIPWVAVAACAALIVLLAQRHRDLTRAYADFRRRTAVLQAGDVVPTFQAATLDGAPVTIGAAAAPDARQVLFILHTSCPYCLATLPIWERLADSLRRVPTPPVEVVGISLDSAAPTRLYAGVHHLPYPVVLFPERKLVGLYRVIATPQTVVLNAEGRVLYARTGLLDNAAVLDTVFRAATARRPRGALPLAASGARPRRE